MRPIHPRMPVILPLKAIDYWLDPELPLDKAQALLRPAPETLLEAYPVSAQVNNPKHNGRS
jgi:putative SOS response-associated peptidase YedK